MFSEMNLLKNLDHPHIVKLYELYQDSNNYYLITEYNLYIKLDIYVEENCLKELRKWINLAREELAI